MNTKIIFFLKTAGLFGFLNASIIFVCSIASQMIYAVYYHQSLAYLYDPEYAIASFFYIVPIVIFFLLFLVGKITEQNLDDKYSNAHSLENQIVGLLLIVISFISFPRTIYMLYSVYIQSAHYSASSLTGTHVLIITSNLLPNIVYLVIGVFLLLFKYSKRTVYDVIV